MSARHTFVELKGTYRWRKLDVCTRCGLKRWEVSFDTKRNSRASMFLFSRTYGDWNTGRPSCAAQAPGFERPTGDEK